MSILIYNNVMEAMQEAEELGGVENLGDYIQLMRDIQNECQERIEVALSKATTEEIEKISLTLLRNVF